MPLNRSDLGQNLEHSFSVSDSKRVAGKKVLLIDDVFTTGATMNECATVMKEAGCQEVMGCAITWTLLKKQVPDVFIFLRHLFCHGLLSQK
jgi:predicted amidophosphoribosyltransferase